MASTYSDGKPDVNDLKRIVITSVTDSHKQKKLNQDQVSEVFRGTITAGER